MALEIETPRLLLRPFMMPDADEIFRCISPTTTRFMSWDPPTLDEYRVRAQALAEADAQIQVQFVIRTKETMECLGQAGVNRLDEAAPELGIYLKASAHGRGFGREAVAAVVAWALAAHRHDGFIYPVATLNLASRRIAEGLGGEVIAKRSSAKYDSVVYRIPRCVS